jgi:hypothetical protein
LAYLDDTLEPAEIKEIGAKVAESESARELINRIKQVTRMRRLTTAGPSGPHARFDPNDVAEYLDNELTPEQIAELEKTCLESDVHLAEIAACHQILTLHLGEPAQVPPTANRRMYQLVRGREAVKTRKPNPQAKAAAGLHADDPNDASDIPLLGKGPFLYWLLPTAALVLVGALALAVWQIIPERREAKRPLASADKKVDKTDGKEADRDKDGKKDAVADKDKKTSHDAEKDKDGKPDKDKKDGGKPSDPIDDEEKKPDTDATVKRTAAPAKGRVLAGRYVGSTDRLPSVLMQRAQDGEQFVRVKNNGSVYTNETLVSLPGFVSEVEGKTGAGLLLRGHVREFSTNPLMDFLMDSAVVLHPNKEFDMDLTLLRGRVYLRNHKKKGPASFRLRFEQEVWDLTLQAPGAEVGVDLFKHFTRDINFRANEEPRAELYLCMIEGEAEFRPDAFQSHQLAAAPGPALFLWDNFTRGHGPRRLRELPPIWSKLPPDTDVARPMTAALKGLASRLESPKAVDVALKEGVEKDDAPAQTRLLSIYCMAAVDELNDLVDRLEDGDPTHYLDRDTAIFALRRWISRSGTQGRLLFNEDKKTRATSGVFIARKYRTSEAHNLFDLLHDFTDEDRKSPDTYEALAACLENPKVSIAELGFWHLRRLAFSVKLPGFNAAAPQEDRKKVADAVRELITKGKLPPPPPDKPKPSGGEGGKDS